MLCCAHLNIGKLTIFIILKSIIRLARCLCIHAAAFVFLEYVVLTKIQNLFWIHFKNDYENKRRRLLYSPSCFLAHNCSKPGRSPLLLHPQPKPTAAGGWLAVVPFFRAGREQARQPSANAQVEACCALSIPPLSIVNRQARVPLYLPAQSCLSARLQPVFFLELSPTSV